MKYLLLLLVSVNCYATDFKYSYIGLTASNTHYDSGSGDFNGVGVSAVKDFNNTLLLGASYGVGSSSISGITINFKEFDVSLGAHFKIVEKIDGIVSLSLLSGSAEANGNSISFTGNSLSAGIRASISDALEGLIGINQVTVAVGSVTTTKSYGSVGLGININEQVQLSLGTTLDKDRTTSVGVRFFFE